MAFNGLFFQHTELEDIPGSPNLYQQGGLQFLGVCDLGGVARI